MLYRGEKLYILDLAGNVIGNFTIPEGEARVLVATEDMVIVHPEHPARLRYTWSGEGGLIE